MPCDTVRRPNQTLQQRNQEITESLARLELYLKTGSVKIQIGSSGAIAFTGWKDRDDITDVCAFRTLSVQGSWALKQAVAKAEAMQGRKVNLRAVAAGVHSHDGGKTWGSH